jgi:hypothetical protein
MNDAPPCRQPLTLAANVKESVLGGIGWTRMSIYLYIIYSGRGTGTYTLEPLASTWPVTITSVILALLTRTLSALRLGISGRPGDFRDLWTIYSICIFMHPYTGSSMHPCIQTSYIRIFANSYIYTGFPIFYAYSGRLTLYYRPDLSIMGQVWVIIWTFTLWSCTIFLVIVYSLVLLPLGSSMICSYT